MWKSYDVFISYRRDGGLEFARCLCYYLRSKGVRCFFDLNDCIGKIDEEIGDAISRSSYFISLLTKDALNRCVDDDDWVRKELEEVLSKDDFRHKVVPITVRDGGFEFPGELPESLVEFTKINQESIDKGRHFEHDIDEMLLKRMPLIGRKIQKRCQRDQAAQMKKNEKAFKKRAEILKTDYNTRIDVGGGHAKLMHLAEELDIMPDRAECLITEVNEEVESDRKRSKWINSHSCLLIFIILFIAVVCGYFGYGFLPEEIRNSILHDWVDPLVDFVGSKLRAIKF